jgi:hypothetical protein
MKIAPLIEIDISQFIPQIVGFILFSIIGAILAARFQYRSWKRQWLVQEASRRIGAASSVYEEISHVVDKRIYRMKQLVYALQSGDPRRIEERRKEYREVLYQWNDNINKYLAKIQIYFGQDARNYFDDKLGKSMVDAAADIHRCLDGRMECAPTTLNALERKLDEVFADIYGFNVELMQKIEKMSDLSKL